MTGIKKDLITDLKVLKYAIGKWSNLRIKRNIDRIITNLEKKRRLVNCIASGRIEIEADNDGAISIYEVK